MSVCEREELLSGWIDGELSESLAEKVEAHVSECAACARLLEELRWLGERHRELHVPEPTAEQWAKAAGRFHERLREDESPRHHRSRLTRYRWVASFLLAVLAIWFFTGKSPAVSIAQIAPNWHEITLEPVAQPVFSMGQATAPDGLNRLPEALAPLVEEKGVVARASGFANLAEVYRENEARSIPHLITMEASEHAFSHLENRLRIAAESELFLRFLKDLLRPLERESRAQAGSLSGAWKQAAEQNAAFFAVALRLLHGGRSAHAPVAKEVALIEAAEGTRRSPVLDRELSYSIFKPRGGWQEDPTRARVFRALVWLGTTFDLGDQSIESACAILMSFAVLSVESALENRDLSGSWLEINRWLESLYGPYTVWSLPELAAAMQKAFGAEVRLDQLDALPAILAEARRGASPSYALIPRRRSISVEAFWAFSTGGLRSLGVERRFPSSVDLSAVLGNPRALELLAEEETPQLVSALGLFRRRWLPTSNPIWTSNLDGAFWLTTGSLEQHGWAVDRPAWQWRLLGLAALRQAGVDVTDHDAGATPWAARQKVFADPFPAYFAGLAARARFLAEAVPGWREEETAEYWDDLDAFASWAEAVERACRRQIADGAPVPGELLQELLGFLPCEHTRSIRDVYRSPSRARYMANGDPDEIWAVIPVGEGTVVARGAAPSTFELIGPADPLWTLADWMELPSPSRPPWYAGYGVRR